MTIVSAADKAGNALSGLYGWVVDRGTASEEFMLGTISGSIITISTRGLDPQDGKTNRAALQFSHRRGATVEISDYPILAVLARLLNADESFPNKLTYASHPTFSNNTEIVDKKYVDDSVTAGAPDAATGTKGIAKASVAPASPTSPIFVGDNDPRVPTQGENDGLAATTTPASGNLFMTQKDFQKAAETYVISTGSANAYVGTHSPALAALTAGMFLSFKANFTNTGAATYNPNSLGATAIKKLDGATALIAGDIVNGQIIVLRYDGTNFQLLSPTANTPPTVPVYKSGTTTRVGNAVSNVQTIAHGLGFIPKYVRFTADMDEANASEKIRNSIGVYNGTTTSTIWHGVTTQFTSGTDSTSVILIKIGNAEIQAAVVTFDATNITLTWTFTNTGTPEATTINILWEAFA